MIGSVNNLSGVGGRQGDKQNRLRARALPHFICSLQKI